MTQAEIQTMLDGVGIPTAYYQFPNGTEVAPPFICFYFDSSNDVYADNSNYQRIDHLVIELYTREKDFGLERTLEDILRSHGLTWSKSETFLDDDLMLYDSYDIDILITEELNNG